MNISRKNFKYNLLTLSLALIFPTVTYATIGANDYGYGNISKGMAGTGVALPTDSFTSAINPAGEVFIKQRVDLGLTVFSPRRGYTANNIGSSSFGVAPGSVSSAMNYFFVPNVGYVGNFANNRGAWGVSMYGNGGMNTYYPGAGFPGSTLGTSPGVYASGTAGIDLKQMFLNLSLAWKLAPNFSIGASLIPVIEMLNVRGTGSFAGFSVSPGKLSNRNTQTKYGLGFRVGALFMPNHQFAFGAGFQPKISISKFPVYSGFLSNHGNLDIPANGTVGMTVTPKENLHINFDVQEIWYSTSSSYSNPNNCVLGSLCLGATGGAGFGWNNATAYKIGGEWRSSNKWTWRLGYIYNTQVVPGDQVFFNILAPAVVQNHITAGFSHDFSPNFVLNVSGMYAPKTTVKGSNQFNSAQTIKLYMYQYELGASLSWILA